MAAYYNELDPYAADWLRNLIAAGHIAPGDVDTRSIEDVTPEDLRGYTQCHFFAGIGVWSHALRRAGWPDSESVWTGSCPCQPFSAAGKGLGFADERHLWSAWHWLIQECRPAVIFGEQVASKAVDAWIDLVHADLEALDYAIGCVPFPSAGVGAPNIRDRTYWVADADSERRAGKHALLREKTRGWDTGDFSETPRGSETLRLADASSVRLIGGKRPGSHAETPEDFAGKVRAERLRDESIASSGDVGGLAHAGEERRNGLDTLLWPENTRGWQSPDVPQTTRSGEVDGGRPSPTNGFWRGADWLLCRDEKWRPVEPDTFPLADGATSRVGRLRAYGNAINAEAAVAFILSARGALWSNS